MSSSLYPDIENLAPSAMCQHPNIDPTKSGGLYCPDCGKCFTHTEAVSEMEEPITATSRFAYRPGESEYDYYKRLFPLYDPRD